MKVLLEPVKIIKELGITIAEIYKGEETNSELEE
jgi:hypothetical protein